MRHRALLAAGASGVSKTLTYLQRTDDAVDRTTYTFSAVNLGAASATRYIVCAITARVGGTSALTINSVTIGGVTATALATQITQVSNTDASAIYVAAVPSGTTGDVVIEWSRIMSRCAIDLWSASGITATPTDAQSSASVSPSKTLTTTAGGFAVAASVTFDGTVGAAFAWTGATERYDGYIATAETSGRASTADTTASGTSTTVAVTHNGTSEPATVWAAW